MEIEEILALPIVQAAADLAKSEMQSNDPSHDFYHINRVVNMAIHILKNEPWTEPVDKLSVVLGAYLHDVGDYKYSGRYHVFPVSSCVY